MAKEQVPELQQLNLSLDPGRPISYWLGWAGFSTMLLTNLYIIRKRAGWMQNMGRLPRWLDFHIFCGLMGPVLIIFHTNFKVDGLVAISFWSMIVSASSGIVGRYFYVQFVQQRSSLNQAAEKFKEQYLGIKTRLSVQIPDEILQRSRPVSAAISFRNLLRLRT